MILYKLYSLKHVVTELLLSGGEDHVREFLQELKTYKLNEEDVIAGKCNMYHLQDTYYVFGVLNFG